MKKPVIVTTIVTTYLVLYYTLFNAGVSENIIILMFIASPFLVIWLAVTILKYGQSPTAELPENKEWGYSDMDEDPVGTF
ncbi:MAG TPA: hypothetical protein VF008_12945 [Niastella sp.]